MSSSTKRTVSHTSSPSFVSRVLLQMVLSFAAVTGTTSDVETTKTVNRPVKAGNTKWSRTMALLGKQR
ncbi:hypothetical protein N7478_000938 [Penicillium angulare]|uniref:uncharacterized protein n=1 Tax=Penicillium angulare TaxID=116970 RepID=UPI0025423F6A|nr:uncharacterized protein N7478_000938 [Penicillium angulare]KAJ5291687.1 hypothetical protein N7478_000938 [Penicillium angulare]